MAILYCVENSGKKNQAQVKLAPEIFKID